MNYSWYFKYRFTSQSPLSSNSTTLNTDWQEIFSCHRKYDVCVLKDWLPQTDSYEIFYSNVDLISLNPDLGLSRDLTFDWYYNLSCWYIYNITYYTCNNKTDSSKFCKFWNEYLPLWYSSVFYESLSVPFDQKCKSEIRSCNSDWIFNWSYENTSCYVEKIIKNDQVQSMGTAISTWWSWLLHIWIQLLPYAIALTLIFIIFLLIKRWSKLKTSWQLNRIKRQKIRRERDEIKRYSKKK